VRKHKENVDCWCPGDLFSNVGVLQVFNLHPAQCGIAGSGYAVSIILSDSIYNNTINITNNILEIFYQYPVNGPGKSQLLTAMNNHRTIRVFVLPTSSQRTKFVQPHHKIMYLCDATLIEHNEEQHLFKLIGVVDPSLLH